MDSKEVIEFKRRFSMMLLSSKYITFKEYNRFLSDFSSLIAADLEDEAAKDIFNNGYEKIDYHNKRIIDKLLLENRDYFDNMFGESKERIILDDEQRRAILDEEDYTLIIAGAGAGKTTTMAAKVKYLIDKLGIEPSRIACISYTNKATEELEDRIKYEFNLPVDIMTFHSLGIRMIRKVFKNPLRPIAEKEQKEIIVNFVREILFPNKELLSKYVKTFNKYSYDSSRMFSKGFVGNYEKFGTFEEYFIDYKKRKQEINKDKLENIIAYRTEAYLRQVVPKTLKEESMRSRAEARIANFLFVNGIDYKYEEPYPEKVDEDRAYLPDFTIEVDGIPLYIEYFGLSSFYEGGSISSKNQKKYADIRLKKRAFHKLNKNNYIELDYKKVEEGEEIDYLKDLERQLARRNVKFKNRTNEEIYDQILDNNMAAEFFHFVDFVLEIIYNIKSSLNRSRCVDIIRNYIEKLDTSREVKTEKIEEANLVLKVYEYYQKELLPKNRIDFSDMIYYANKYMKSLPEGSNVLDYDYLIVDEYQDISLDRYYFARNISLLSNAKVIAVGDDWQTIFSFAGSRIDLFLKYNKLFPGAKQLYINNTYRSSQQLIDKAGSFIMKNPLQIKKKLLSIKNRRDPIKFYVYEDNQYEIVKNILTKIYRENKNHRVMILARKNKHIRKMLETTYFQEGIGTRVIFKDLPHMIIDAMSVHMAKGLSADEVIILNVTNVDFPCPEQDPVWISGLFKPSEFDEGFPNAEERRIFYVALTRTKNDVYLLIPKSKQSRSPFVNELL